MLLSVDPRPFMANPLELSLSDSFNRERFTRIINECSDVKELRQIAVLLLGCLSSIFHSNGQEVTFFLKKPQNLWVG